MKTSFHRMLVAGVVLLSAAAVCAAPETKTDAKTQTPSPQAQPPVLSPEQQAMMARMTEYSTPNEHHDVLKSLEGTWKTQVKFWMDPKGEPEVSEGTSDAKIIFGGRFLEQTFSGTAMGKPFEGRGIIGYDNLRKEYTGIWFDNMATGIMTSSGKYDPDTKIITEEGSLSCPITGEAHRWYRSAWTVSDRDHNTYQSYSHDARGQEYKSLEIHYTRSP